jgi:hypothetical protein
MRPGTARRLSLLGALAASVACLAAAFAAAGVWIAAGLVMLPGVLMAFHAKARGGWVASAFLAAMACAAAVAAVVGAPALLVVPGAALALAAWDLAELDRFLRDGRLRSAEEPAGSTKERPAGGGRAENALVKRHALSLIQALALGLLAAGGGLVLSLQIPFVLLFLLVILDLACLGYVLLLFGR